MDTTAPAAARAPTPPDAPREPHPARRRHAGEWALLAGLLALALAVRLADLGAFPDTMLADEGDNAQYAIRILHGQPPPNGFFGLDWKPQPAYSVYLMSAFLQVFGVSLAAVRLPSAVLSTLALLPFFLLLRRQFAPVTALLATALLATNLWYLNFSRSGWENVHVALYMLGAMLCLLRGVDAVAQQGALRWRWGWFAAAGVFCTLGLYGYFAGRAIILAVLVFFPIAVLYYRRHWRRLVLGYALLGLVTLVLAWPQATYVLQHWDLFNGRVNNVLLLNNPDYKKDPPGMLRSQIERNLRSPWDGSVNNTPQYTPVNEPQLDRISGGLALLGMALSLVLGWRRPETWLWWVMLAICWAFTQLLTIGTPNGARGVGWMPALLAFAACSLDVVPQLCRRLPGAPRLLAVARWLPVAALAVVIGGVCYDNLTRYVAWQSAPGPRQARAVYVTAAEFPAWTDYISALADNGRGIANVGGWRDTHPEIPRDLWPRPLATIGAGQLVQPRAVAVSTAGTVYVLDGAPPAQRVQQYAADGRLVRRWDGPDGVPAAGGLAGAVALAIDYAGTVFVLDGAAGVVALFDGEGHFMRRWDAAQTGLDHPQGLSVDAAGRLYLADTGNRRVRVYTPDGAVQQSYSVAGGLSEGEWPKIPVAVAPLAAGQFAVADAAIHFMGIYDPTGHRRHAAEYFAAVNTSTAPVLAALPDGTFYATIPDLCKIIHYDVQGQTLGAGGDCAAPDYLTAPRGIAVGPGGTVYVADLGANVVRVFAGGQ